MWTLPEGSTSSLLGRLSEFGLVLRLGSRHFMRMFFRIPRKQPPKKLEDGDQRYPAPSLLDVTCRLIKCLVFREPDLMSIGSYAQNKYPKKGHGMSLQYGWRDVHVPTFWPPLHDMQWRYYQRMKIQPAAGDGRSRAKFVLPENENPAGCRRRPLQ